MADDSQVTITSTEDLVEHLSLLKIHTYQLAAFSRDEFGSTPDDEVPVEPGDETGTVRTGVRVKDRRVDYRVSVTMQHATGQIIADMAIMFECDIPLEITPELEPAIVDFGDRVALMALFPYLREAVSDLGRRVAVDIVLPMVYPGQFSFKANGES